MTPTQFHMVFFQTYLSAIIIILACIIVAASFSSSRRYYWLAIICFTVLTVVELFAAFQSEFVFVNLAETYDSLSFSLAPYIGLLTMAWFTYAAVSLYPFMPGRANFWVVTSITGMMVLYYLGLSVIRWPGNYVQTPYLGIRAIYYWLLWMRIYDLRQNTCHRTKLPQMEGGIVLPTGTKSEQSITKTAAKIVTVLLLLAITASQLWCSAFLVYFAAMENRPWWCGLFIVILFPPIVLIRWGIRARLTTMDLVLVILADLPGAILGFQEIFRPGSPYVMWLAPLLTTYCLAPTLVAWLRVSNDTSTVRPR